MKLLPTYKMFLEKEEESVKVAVSGDVMFGRFVGKEYHELDILNPFSQAQEILRSADLSIVNLETPLYDGTPTWWSKYPIPKGYQKTLVAPTYKVNDLINGGINVVSLANNHADDAGYEGFESTQMVLDTAGIMHAGTSVSGDPFEPIMINVKGREIVFFSATLERNFGKDWGNANEYAPPIAYIDNTEKYEKLLGMINSQRSMFPSAFIIVSIHWGIQYSQHVKSWQEMFAKDIVNAGANCILGHHPHVVQKVSSYKDAIIFFSLGNLLFDHNYNVPGHGSIKNQKTKEGAIYVFDIGPENIVTNLEKYETLSTPQGVTINR